MGTTTPNHSLYKPDLDEADSSCYDDINSNFDKLDAAVTVLGKQHTASSVTGTTSDTTLYSLVIPGGTIKANGALRIWPLFSFTGSTNLKTMKVKLGGTVFLSVSSSATANISAVFFQMIRNRNSQSAQVAGNTTGGFGVQTNAVYTGAVDTSVNQTLEVTGQLANSGETITLESVAVEVLR